MAIITQDPFTEAADTDLAAHTPNTTGQAWVVLEQPGNPTLDCEGGTGLMGSANTGNGGRCVYTSRPNPAVLDIDMQITVVTLQTGVDDPFAFVARATAANNYYSGGCYNNDATADKKIFKQVAGVKTELASGDTGLAANDVMKFEVRDATKKLYKNGVEQLSTTDNALTANGSCGFGVGNIWAIAGDDVAALWRWDNYIVTEIVAAGSTSLPLRPPSLMPMLMR